MAQAQMMAAAGATAVALFAAYQYNQMAPPAPPKVALKNQAFVFLKPHAANENVAALVKEKMAAKGIVVKGEGDIDCKDIDEKKLIDQHYYAIASKATILKPEAMNVPADKFEATFKKSWETVLKEKKAMNALDACKELGVDAKKMADLWAGCKKSGKLAKLGGGFYCGEITHAGKTLYVFNGFFMEMRSGFTAPGKKIHFYDVEWDPKELSWEDFRGKLLGPTDPKEAPKDSLRGLVLGDWKKLGLASEPNTGDNAVHASASPFEALAERMNWLGVKCSNDVYCKALVAAGIPEKTIDEWTRDPQVFVDSEKSKKKSLFDTLEDQNADVCLANAKKLCSFQ